MRNGLTWLAFIAAAACATVMPARAAGIGEPTCYIDWSDAAPIVVREHLVTVRDLHAEARTRYNGDLVRITLCHDEVRFTYRLLVRDGQGRISGVTVDAREPFATDVQGR
jgi:hypothetical protein